MGVTIVILRRMSAPYWQLCITVTRAAHAVEEVCKMRTWIAWAEHPYDSLGMNSVGKQHDSILNLTLPGRL